MKCGSVEVWKCGSVEVWKCGSVEVWKCGSVVVWCVWKCGVCGSVEVCGSVWKCVEVCGSVWKLDHFSVIGTTYWNSTKVEVL
jgi:hypothetical protein